MTGYVPKALCQGSHTKGGAAAPCPGSCEGPPSSRFLHTGIRHTYAYFRFPGEVEKANCKQGPAKPDGGADDPDPHPDVASAQPGDAQPETAKPDGVAGEALACRYAHTYIHTYIHTHKYIHMYYVRTYVHSYTSTGIHACIRVQTYVNCCTCMRTHTHTSAHVLVHMECGHTGMYIHTPVRMSGQMLSYMLDTYLTTGRP